MQLPFSDYSEKQHHHQKTMADGQRYTAVIPQSDLGCLGYDNFTVHLDQPLGRGSYGAVYRATYDDLPCAAKILHPTMVSGGVIDGFKQECKTLSKIKHPNVVLYLGLRTDPVSHMPVLLMEIMDESLTKMLQASRQSLPYCVQVDICHDVSLALSYLHGHDIIHRDLSGNNVLVSAKRKAKVTDFGMSCITNHLKSKGLTSCPGTLVYMPPEAVQDRPMYTKSLDIFSFGVITIQVLTQLVPDPTPRTKEVTTFCNDQLQLTGRFQVVVSEYERRAGHIALIEPATHPLLKTATQCIQDDPIKRPGASGLCRMFNQLKQSQMYADSSRAVNDDVWISGQSNKECSLHADEKQAVLTGEVQRLHEMNQRLSDDLLQKDVQLKQAGSLLTGRDKEIRRLLDTNRSIIEQHQFESREKDSLMSSNQSQIAALSKALHEKKRSMEDYQRIILNLEERLKAVELHHSHDQSFVIIPPTTRNTMNTHSQMIESISQSKATIPLHRGACAAHDGKVYFTFGATVLVYSIHSQSWGWGTESECPQSNGGFTIVRGLPTMVGGYKEGRVTNDLVSLVDGMWIETFPQMPTPRSHSSAVTACNHVIVAGGSSSPAKLADVLTVVEVMEIENYNTEQAWSTVCRLSHPIADASVAVHEGRMVLVGGINHYGKTLVNLACDIPALLNTKKAQSRNPKAKAFGMKVKRALDPTSSKHAENTVWTTMGESGHFHATCVSVCGHLLAVGGCDENGTSTNSIHRYDFSTSLWEHIGYMGSEKWLSYATGLPGNQLMVVGGFQQNGTLSDSVEIYTVSL